MSNRKQALQVIKCLQNNGYQALFAGGCVRDMLLKRPAKDYDIATDARPQDVSKLFRRTLKVGAQFGVTIVLIEGKQVEVAAFRTESDYLDGRHPEKVVFSNPKEDANRRDFTINGMFYDPVEKKIIDYVNGRQDLDKRVIRTIGAPQERFAEDYLRMLRAVRFSTQLSFEIDKKTFKAIKTNAENICKISGERIRMELEGILTNPARDVGLSLLNKTGLLSQIFPAFSNKDLEPTTILMRQLPKRISFPLALASLFSDFSTDSALSELKVLKLSRKEQKHIRFLFKNRGILLKENISLARLRLLVAEPYFQDLYKMQKAIQKSQGGKDALKPLIKLRRRIRDLGDIELKPKPFLNGYQLIKLGAVPGPALGQLAEEMYIAQLEGNITNTKEAKKWVEDWLQKHK